MSRSRFRNTAFGALFVILSSALATAQAAPPSTKAEELSAAARRGDAAAVKKLLDDGVDPNTKFRYEVTALIYACDHGHLDVVKVLLDHKADINARENKGRTPLHLAIKQKFQLDEPSEAKALPVVRLLLERKADLSGLDLSSPTD